MHLRLSLAIASCAAVCAGASVVKPLRVHGIVSAVFSPFTTEQNGQKLNISVVAAQSKYLKETGVEWVFVGGTTGESLSLTLEERLTLTEAWIKTGTNVIAHVGAECLQDAQALARHAEATGAKAIGAMPPVFFKPANAQALALTISAICAAAKSLPCYYYHIPSMTGYAKPMIDFVKAIAPLADNFAGIKYTGLYTNPGFMDAQRVLNYDGGRFEVLGGREEMLLEALAIGMTGFVGSQFNIAGDLFNAIIQKFEAGGLTATSQDELRALQFSALELISAWGDSVPEGVNGNKHFMNLAGVPVGEARLPSLPVSVGTAAALKKSFATFCQQKAALKLRMCM